MYFGQENVQLHCIDTDSLVLSVDTKDISKGLKTHEYLLDFSNLHKNQKILSKKNNKVIVINKIETPKNIWLDYFTCFRAKVYSFKCKIDIESKNQLRGISKSQSKQNKIEDYRKRLDGVDYPKECDIPSNNHEMDLQKVQKSTLSLFDEN